MTPFSRGPRRTAGSRLALSVTTAVAGLAGLVGLVALAPPSSAHVTITPSATDAGAYVVATVALSHGCDGAATTRVAISMPEQLLSVKPTRHPLWDVEVVRERLAEPQVDAHGNAVSERVAEIVYTARSPLPDGVRDSFELSFQVPDVPGQTLTFPSIQTCTKGETAWTELPAEGESADGLETPAPSFVVTDPEAPEAAAATSPEDTDSAGQGTDRGTDPGTLAALLLGALGILLGGASLAQVRRRR